MTFWQFFFLLLIYIPLLMLWIFALSDLARRADLSGVAKGLWAVAVVLLPLLGMLIYFITRPDDPDMQPDAATAMRAAVDKQAEASTVDQLETLANLREAGTLSEEEFTKAKAKLLDAG
ncbi:MAG: SHOCT domain-containing protein [Actinomycetota bacterium]